MNYPALINANSLHIPLAPASVHMLACSPPYWGLRDYGNPEQLGQEELHDCLAWARGERPCGRCYVCAVRAVANEAWRVLRDDGTFWLNLGDSYAGSGKGGQPEKLSKNWQPVYPNKGNTPEGLKPKDLALIPARVALALQADGWYVRQDVIWSKTNPMSESVNGWRWERHKVKTTVSRRARNSSAHAKAQEGVNMPHSERDGAAWVDQSSRYVDCPGCEKCEADNGYVLRRGAWRPTKAHEYIFLLAKSEKYYCDKYAVTEPYANSSIQRISQPTFDQQTGGDKDYGKNGVNPSRTMRKSLENLKSAVRFGGNKADGYGRTTYSGDEWQPDSDIGRNKWSVWTLPTKGYPGAHFAVWPPELVEPMIKAGTSEKGVCPECGAPWARVIHKGDPEPRSDNPNPVRPYEAASKTQGSQDSSTTLHMTRETKTVYWLPTCNCGHNETVPATVLDIFAGSGTTLQVARSLGRFGVGLDVSFDYLVNEAKTRLELDALEAWENGEGVESAPVRKTVVKIPAAQMSLL